MRGLACSLKGNSLTFGTEPSNPEHKKPEFQQGCVVRLYGHLRSGLPQILTSSVRLLYRYSKLITFPEEKGRDLKTGHWKGY